MLLNEEIETLNEDIGGLMYNEAALRKAGGERLKAYIFIQGADNKRFKDRHRELKKSLALGDNKISSDTARSSHTPESFL